jgi:hypothetical protein
MKVIYEGVNIYPDISVNSCVHDMYLECRPDTLELRVNDTKYLWNRWKPKEGDKISVSEESADTGEMYITRITPENGFYALRAASLPLNGGGPRNKAWEAVYFLQLAREIAGRYNLSFEQYGISDQFYQYINQDNMTDFSFLQRLCILESCSFLIFDGKLVLFSEPFMEAQSSAGKIKIYPHSRFDYRDRSANNYGSAIIQSGQYLGEFTNPQAAGGKILRPIKPIYVSGNGEALRFARGLLRSANKNAHTGSVEKDFLPEYAAGSVAELVTEGESVWDGRIFIHHMRHDYVNKASKMFLRKPLQGY